MATYTAAQASHITTVANQVDTLTLSGTGTKIRFIVRSGTSHVFFTTAQPDGTPATPTVGGDNCLVGDPSGVLDYPWSGNGVVIKLIAGGIDTISIMLI